MDDHCEEPPPATGTVQSKDSPQGLRGILWAPIFRSAIPTAVVPALVCRWVLAPHLQQRRPRFDACCRIRPMNAREKSNGSNEFVTATGTAPPGDGSDSVPPPAATSSAATPPSNLPAAPATVTFVEPGTEKQRSFPVDAIVGGSDQALPFDVVRPYLHRFVHGGEPGGVIAYGQTGAGKTFTTLGLHDPAPGPELEGTAVRAAAYLLQQLALQDDGATTRPRDDSRGRRVLLLNLYEICARGKLKDLTPSQAETMPSNNGDGKGSVDAFIEGGGWARSCHRGAATAPPVVGRVRQLRHCAECREAFVESSPPLHVDTMEAFLAALAAAEGQRSVAPTMMGAVCSRNHLVVSFAVAAPSADPLSEPSICRFDFVDMVGSERVGGGGCMMGSHIMRERAAMNQMLTGFRTVVEAIVKEKQHVPYRDSLLTALLTRSAFSDTARTLLIGCCSPADINALETMATLHFVSRARGSVRPDDVFD